MTESSHRPRPDAPSPEERSEGPAAVALLAAAVGVATLGVLTTLAEASSVIKTAFALNAGVGPLSGKVVAAVVVWVFVWFVLHLTLTRRISLGRTVLSLATILLMLGVLGTFPPFYQLFGP